MAVVYWNAGNNSRYSRGYMGRRGSNRICGEGRRIKCNSRAKAESDGVLRSVRHGMACGKWVGNAAGTATAGMKMPDGYTRGNGGVPRGVRNAHSSGKRQRA